MATRARTRARTRHGHAEQPVDRLRGADHLEPFELLPPELIATVLHTCSARELCRIARISRAFAETNVPAAVEERSRLLGYKLPPLHEDEAVLHALHFTELVDARPRCTMAADTCHTVCIRPSDGVPYVFGGHERGPDFEEDEDDDDEQHVCLSHLGLGQAVGPIVGVPTPICGLGGVRICEVAAGYEHTLLLSACGRVYSCGIGDHGRLGHGWDPVGGYPNCRDYAVPRRIEFGLGLHRESKYEPDGTTSTPRTWRQRLNCAVLAIINHSRQLSDAFSEWGRANLNWAQHEQFLERHEPELMPRVVQVAAGGFQSCCISADGRAWSWGWGDSGSLGHGRKVHCSSPTVLAAFIDASIRIVQVSAGSGHTLHVSEAGRLYSCGEHKDGKLGLAHAEPLGLVRPPAPLGATPTFSAEGPEVLTPTLVRFPRGVRIRQASAWHAHSLAVTTSDMLYSFGSGQQGALGHGNQAVQPTPRKVRAFSKQAVSYAAAGEQHSCVLTRDGHCHTFGDPAYGQLGNGWTSASGISCYCAPTAVQLPAAVAAHVTEVACGDHHTLVRLATGDVYSFGMNAFCQLGLAATEYEWARDSIVVHAPSKIAWEPKPPKAEAASPHPSQAETLLYDD